MGSGRLGSARCVATDPRSPQGRQEVILPFQVLPREREKAKRPALARAMLAGATAVAVAWQPSRTQVGRQEAPLRFPLLSKINIDDTLPPSPPHFDRKAAAEDSP